MEFQYSSHYLIYSCISYWNDAKTSIFVQSSIQRLDFVVLTKCKLFSIVVTRNRTFFLFSSNACVPPPPPPTTPCQTSQGNVRVPCVELSAGGALERTIRGGDIVPFSRDDNKHSDGRSPNPLLGITRVNWPWREFYLTKNPGF